MMGGGYGQQGMMQQRRQGMGAGGAAAMGVGGGVSQPQSTVVPC